MKKKQTARNLELVKSRVMTLSTNSTRNIYGGKITDKAQTATTGNTEGTLDTSSANDCTANTIKR